MGLQEELEYYLKLYGITKTHMAKTLNIHIQQISAWTNGKLTLSDYQIARISEYVDTLKRVNVFLKENSLLM